MALVIVCRDCGEKYEPSADDIAAGRWQVCPECRESNDVAKDAATNDERTER